jgi:hypothetical protein
MDIKMLKVALFLKVIVWPDHKIVKNKNRKYFHSQTLYSVHIVTHLILKQLYQAGGIIIQT